MKWITQLFLQGKDKGTIKRRDKEQINRLVMIAALENRIEPSDLSLLTEQLKFIRYEELPDKHQQILHYKKELPHSTKEKFNLIFLLVTSLMRNGALSEKKEQMLARIIQVMQLKKEKANELISFMKSNIRHGLNIEDSFLRLGYLLEDPRFG